jgi:DNA-binding MarR family transcriptional regulator
VLISLTERGREVVDEVVARHVERELLSVLSQREQDQLAGLLRKLLIGIDDVPPEAASRPVRSTDFSPL